MTLIPDFGGCFGDKRLDDRGGRVFGRMVEKKS